MKNSQDPCSSRPSYAQIVSPHQHGVKRRSSDRVGLSPGDYCSKRSAYSRNNEQRVQYTPPAPSTVASSENIGVTNETPEYDMLCGKANDGAVQRRLFGSPNTTQSTPTRSTVENW